MWTPQHMRKIFIGGLDYGTTNESLQEHFSNYGEIIDSIVMKDPTTQRSRGFGFITFVSPDHVDAVQKARPHKVDGKLVETKRAVPRTDIAISSPGPAHGSYGYSRLFIGGLPQDVNESELEQYFKHFGDVTSVTIMYEKGSDRHRGFAFVDFSDYDHVDKVLLTHGHTIKGRPIDVKKAIKKGEINKMKSLISGISKSEAATLAASGFGKLARGVPATNASPSTVQPDNGNVKVPEGSNVNLAKNLNSNGNPVDSSTLNDMMKLCFLGHPCVPRMPYNQPGFSTQLPSGWQYTVSNNAEVLRNTGVESDADSDASSNEPIQEASEPIVVLADGSLPNIPADITHPNSSVLLIEPFFGGSHSQLINTIKNDFAWGTDELSLLTLPAKKWHWKARTSALYFYQKIPQTHKFKYLFASSTLNLCELLSLRPDLNQVTKVLYFHENQLVYPIRKPKPRDFQYGYNQILSSMVADVVVFNSQYNLESFIREIPRFLKHQPGSENIMEKIKLKSKVLYYPVNICHMTRAPKDALDALHIVWPHRWEHDKDPDTFFHVLFQLADAGLNFKISILGESFSEIPPIFIEAKQKLSTFINHWGFEKDKERYWEILHSGDVVVSTAHHEFFGVSMLEAVGAGCIPLCPNRLVYPEIYPQDCLYNTTEQLQKTLGQWCSRPQLVRSRKVKIDLTSFSWQTLRKKYIELLKENVVFTDCDCCDFKIM